MSDNALVNFKQQNASAQQRVVFLHGSGGGPDTAFMDFFAEQCVAAGNEVVRPQFPYWEHVLTTGKPRPPNNMPVLVDSIAQLLSELQQDNKPLVLMGKSLGSRVMLRLADEFAARRQIALGFPFNPPSKPENSRLHELAMTKVPGLILQGTRDPFSKPLRQQPFELPDTWTLQWLEQGDHGFQATRAKSALTPVIWQQAADAIRGFIQ